MSFTTRVQRSIRYRVGEASGAVLSDVAHRRLRVTDPTLRTVLRALRTPAPDEAQWASRVETRRRALEQSKDRMRFQIAEDSLEFWRQTVARSQDPEPPQLDGLNVTRTLGEVTRATSKGPDWCVAFFRVVRALRPRSCLELGTSVGMSGAYLAAGLEANDRGTLVTIEADPESRDVAQGTFRSLELDNRVDSRLGLFADVLPSVLNDMPQVDLAFIDGHHRRQPTWDYFQAIREHVPPGGLMIFDDVTYRYGNMAEAWSDIQASSRVTGSVTIGPIGFAVVDGVADEHFQIPRLRI